MRLLPVVILAAGAISATATEPPSKIDLYGDPLPPGAIQRLGTVRHRVLGETFRFTPDGKSIVAVAWGRYVSVIDAKTGLVTSTWTIPVEDARTAVLFPTAAAAVVVRQPRHESGDEIWEVWDLQRKRLVRSLGTVKKAGELGGPPTPAPDGKSVAYSIDRGEVTVSALVDLDTGKTYGLARDAAVPGDVYLIVDSRFTPDGRYLLGRRVTSQSTEVRCWDPRTGRRLWTKWFDRDRPGRLSVTPDGHVLLWGDDVAYELDPATGGATERKWPRELRTEIGWPDFLPGGLAVVDKDTEDHECCLTVWDWRRGERHTPPGGWNVGRWSDAVAHSPDGRWALRRDRGPEAYPVNGHVRLFDLTTGRPAWPDTFPGGHGRAVTYLRFSADGRRLVSSGDDGTVRAWDLPTGRPLGRWPCEASNGFREPTGLWSPAAVWPRGMAAGLTRDGSRLALVDPPTKDTPVRLRVIDLDSGSSVVLAGLPGPRAGEWRFRVGPVLFDRSEAAVFVPFGDSDSIDHPGPTQTLARWDLTRGRWTDAGRCEPAPPGRSAVSHGGGQFFAYGKKLDARTGKDVLELRGAQWGPLALTADDKLIAGVGRLGPEPSSIFEAAIRDLRVWDARTGQVVATVAWTPPRAADKDAPADELRWTWPRRMALHPTGRILATADSHGVRLWDVLAGKLYHTYPLPVRPPLSALSGSPATALAFTPEGTRLATGLPDGTILFWPVPKPEPNPPKADELAGLWADLVGPDAAKGWRAAWRLGDDPAAAVRLVRAKLNPAEPVAADDVRRWLADVDAPDFRRREAATRKLEAVIDRVVPALREALQAAGTSAEARERLRKVVATVPDDDRPLPAWAAGLSRAVAVLEDSGTPESRAALRELAGGAPGAWLTREAQAALDRLQWQLRTTKK